MRMTGQVRALAHIRQQLQAAEVGELDVEEEESGGGPGHQEGAGLLGRCRLGHLVAGPAEEGGDEPAQEGVVVDHQDAGGPDVVH